MARVDITVPMSEDLDEAIKGQLEYGDSRAEWIREAIRQRLEREGVDVSEWRESQTDGGQTVLAGD